METVILVTALLAAPWLGVVGFILSETRREDLIHQEQKEPQVDQELKEAA